MKKILLLCVALILALGTVGAGYALWKDSVLITTTINTGTVQVSLSQYDNDPAPRGPVVGANPNGWYNGSLDPSEQGSWGFDTVGNPVWTGDRYEKNVAYMDSEFDNNRSELHPNPTATITVDNAYPCYYGSVLFDIENTGTIPVKLLSVKLLRMSYEEEVLVFDPPVNVYLPEYRVFNELPPADGWDWEWMTSEVVGPDGVTLAQIDAGQKGYVSFTFHLLQDAHQSKSYDAVFEFTFCNWNE